MQNYYFENYDLDQRVMVEAESFEIACAKMFHQGDEHDLNPEEWELTEVEDID